MESSEYLTYEPPQQPAISRLLPQQSDSIEAHLVRDTGEAGDVHVARLFQLLGIALQRVGLEVAIQYPDIMPDDLSWFEPIKGTNI